MFLNLLVLMVVAAVPWPTAMLAEYLREDKASHVAAAVYSIVMVAMALAFQALWWHLTRTGHLFDDRVDVDAARRTRVRSRSAPSPTPPRSPWPMSPPR